MKCHLKGYNGFYIYEIISNIVFRLDNLLEKSKNKKYIYKLKKNINSTSMITYLICSGEVINICDIFTIENIFEIVPCISKNFSSSEIFPVR